MQQNEPVNKNRSLSLLHAMMGWPQFFNKSSLLQQLLKLENAFIEYDKLGSKWADDLKVAILLRCLSGQLKTWLQLRVTEGTTYSKVREMVLMFDSSTTRWSDSMALGVENAP